MTRILVQRGSTGSSSSSSNQNRSSVSLPGSSASSQTQASSTSQVPSALKDDELVGEFPESIALDEFSVGDDASVESFGCGPSPPEEKIIDHEKISDGAFVCGDSVKGSSGLRVEVVENEGTSVLGARGSSCPPPPPPPVPPPKPVSLSPSPRKFSSGSSNAVRIGSSREFVGQTNVSTRTSPTGSRPSSPQSHCESEGYNSADEQKPNFLSSCNDMEREHQFEIDIRRGKGLEVKKMRGDGNCLFCAVADQVYGDSEAYDLVRQMCIDYMERERNHFSQFITEGFTSYCKRKRRDKVYGNNVEIQALSEMYNRPIYIYSYSIEPMNTFHGSYNSDTPPIRLSYHRGNHYNSLVDPRRLSVGAGLGFSCLRGKNIDKDNVKAAIKAQQDQQIDSALLAEGCFYSDLELTEKEMERMVIEASRAEYIAHDNKFRQQLGHRESSTSGAEPSSSGTRSSGSEKRKEAGRELSLPDSAFSDCLQVMLSMGFSYPQSRKDVEGSLFVVKRVSQPRFQFIVMNRRNTDNLVEDLLGDFEYEIQLPYLLYRNASQEVNGIWFYNQRECEEVANLFDRILGAYSKVPTKSKVPLTKSEFEELEAVPTMAVIDGPLEPASSTASNALHIPEDNSFVNFFSNAMTIGNASSTAVQGQLYNSTPAILPPPRPPASVPPSSAPVLIPSPPLSTSLLRPHLDAPEPDSSAKWSSNLVKPSCFFGPPAASSLLMPPISSSVPTAPPLLPLGNLQRPYGAPLLQPFPPPTPPPSLTPTSAPIPNYGPVVSRDKVREALVMLVQDDQFIDMVYRAVLNAHHS